MYDSGMKLTKTQRRYLETIGQRGTLQSGWGGYKSTITVRILEERGLIRLRRFGTAWTAQLTNAGAEIIGK